MNKAKKAIVAGVLLVGMFLLGGLIDQYTGFPYELNVHPLKSNAQGACGRPTCGHSGSDAQNRSDYMDMCGSTGGGFVEMGKHYGCAFHRGSRWVVTWYT